VRVKRSWHQRTWVIVTLLLFCGPVGLVLLWLRSDWPVKTRGIVTAAVVGFLLLVILTPDEPHSSPIAHQAGATPTATATPDRRSPLAKPPLAKPPSAKPTSADPTAVVAREGLPSAAVGPFAVLEVVDGDTVKVDADGVPVTLRLIGMDTPETKDPRKPVQCFGEEASKRATALLAGKRVYLEYDPSQGKLDKYGRTLAYLWLRGAKARLFNRVMIRAGYAHEYTYDVPYAHQRAFKAAERDARSHERGSWSPATCAGDTTSAVADGSSSTSIDDRDCGDFDTYAEAQDFFKRTGPGDPHRLDGDGDGSVCETLSGSPAETSSGDSTGGDSAGTDPRYDTCGDAIAAGYGPYQQGTDPEYDWYRDSDSDGTVCE
jgi:micrococcal nuclease